MCNSKAQITTSLFTVLLCAPISAQVTQRVSVATSGAQGNADSSGHAISADGRYVAFESLATNLVANDTNVVYDVFVRDRQSGTTDRVSVSTGGAQANQESFEPAISADGRFVVFESLATNLGGSNGFYHVYLRDRRSGTTELVSLSSGGVQGNFDSGEPSISADGRFVALDSGASNLVANDTNGTFDIFVRDRQSGMTERVSVATGGAQGNDLSYEPSISGDGRFVAFYSLASNLVANDTNATWDVFVHDRQSGTTERVSVATGGAQGNLASEYPSISADGRYVAFHSVASTLVANDTNGISDIFVRDRQSGTTERVSVATGGAQATLASTYPWISADGRFVAFDSLAPNLVPGDTNGVSDAFLRDRQSGTTERVSLATNGMQGDSDSVGPAISADGRYLMYTSAATNLVPGDANGCADVFVRVRQGGTNFTSLCDPGIGGAIACPCSNPPSGPGRGCNNSSATGGAILSASGGTYLSSDSLVFTTSGERPTAFGILLQGTTVLPNGLIYGQGIRCVGGSLKRLFAKTASGGSIIAPDFGAGDPTVSARSAAKGDVIQAGQSRWYLVFYRDPNVLGGCPASSTFNATQTGQVSWSP